MFVFDSSEILFSSKSSSILPGRTLRTFHVVLLISPSLGSHSFMTVLPSGHSPSGRFLTLLQTEQTISLSGKKRGISRALSSPIP